VKWSAVTPTAAATVAATGTLNARVQPASCCQNFHTTWLDRCRYSFGSAPAHFGLQEYWAVLIDPPVLSEVLTAVFGTRDYITGSASSGGDYNIPCVSLHLKI
jgi:hypothetical protein